jgi:hypothetical protein
MQLTYTQALDQIIEHTEIGYSIRSQDRLWICFIYDLWSDGEYADFRFNRLYPLVGDKPGVIAGTAYDRDMSHKGLNVPVWTDRQGAEHFAAGWRDHLHYLYDSAKGRTEEKPEVYVINLGDDARFEDQVLGGYKRARSEPKFAGSRDAWDAMIQMHLRWSMYAIERTVAEKQDAEGSCP